MPGRPSTPLAEVLRRRLIFVGGKGGVGKTVVSRALAESLARRGKRTLWVQFEDPFLPPGELKSVAPNLWSLNCEATAAFEEYAGMKIGVAPLTRIFLQNKLMRYLAKAAPGIHELVLLGKVWHERERYDHVVADMPSTGYGLAMFQSTENFARLFKGGPVHRDAEAMLATFRDATQTGHLIVALPEEMPLREALELEDFLLKLFPANPAAFIANRLFPNVSALASGSEGAPEDDGESPLAADAQDYARRRSALERHNLRLWREEGLTFSELGFVPPDRPIVPAILEELQSTGHL